MTTEAKTHEIDGVLYVEDGHPEPATMVQAPIIYDGVLLTGKAGDEIPEWVRLDGIKTSKTIQLRRLEP